MPDITSSQSNSLDEAVRIMTGIVRGIVIEPETVSAELGKEPSGWVIRIKISQRDSNTVMDQRGRTFRSLGTICAALSKRSQEVISLEISSQ